MCDNTTNPDARLKELIEQNPDLQIHILGCPLDAMCDEDKQVLIADIEQLLADDGD